MTYLEFIVPLVRLSKHRVGMAESAFLMCCASGATVDQLSRILGVDKRIIRGRGGILKSKKLIRMESDENWRVTYYPTDKGREIILDVMGGNKQPTKNNE